MIILTWKRTKNLEIKFQLIWLSHPRSREIWPRTKAVSSCRITESGQNKVFWTWLEKMFISSNMRWDISLLDVYCGAAMIEIASGLKNLRFDGFSGRKHADELLRIMKRVTGVKQ